MSEPTVLYCPDGTTIGDALALAALLFFVYGGLPLVLEWLKERKKGDD